MKEMLTFKGCYFGDNNYDNDDGDDVDDDCDERKRRLNVA
jgi:regulator of RNase E activity RraB